MSMYHPLKGQAGNSMPPTSNFIELTAGRAYHCNCKLSNHSYFGWVMGTRMTRSSGRAKSCGSSPGVETMMGRMSHFEPVPFQPSFWQIWMWFCFLCWVQWQGEYFEKRWNKKKNGQIRLARNVVEMLCSPLLCNLLKTHRKSKC